ncbi:glycohydrolase toxin TNT-related protein [Chryseobacterium taichungense]|uniref:glycohydrolase toxin TNT-related protein n=1 Tax=Chryseobacterium taichungense TaxID=295069 RepID=UPI0028ABA077|nr:glycohydrolase toxin TNT-related protein [Chryseobacterium taichungense]
MSRHKKTFAPRASRSGSQNIHRKEDEENQEKITPQDVTISLAKTEVTQITYGLFRNRAFKKVENGSVTIKFLEKGPHVLILHKALNTLGYKAVGNGSSFWKETKMALISFQQKNNITATGIFNRETLLKMDEVLGKDSNDEEDKFPIYERAKMLYDAFEYSTWGIFGGTDEDKVFKALEKLSTVGRKELITYYDQKYKPKRKAGLVKDLYKELGDKDLYRAIRLLYGNYQEPQPQSQETDQEPKGQLLQEVIIYARRPYPWIKSKTQYTIEGELIEFECMYQNDTPIMYATGNTPKIPEVVRKVLVQVDNKVYNLSEYPPRNIKTFRQDGNAISQFSIAARKSGVYTFVFFIENAVTHEFVAYTQKHQVKTLEEAATDGLKENKAQNYRDFRQQIAFIDFNLSKGAFKDQRNDLNFFIKSESNKNPAEVGTIYSNYTPHLYYSIKGKPISKDQHYFWFAEINTPKEMSDATSALLGVQYSKDANVLGYKRGEYFGKDGWNMNSSQTTAAFLGSFTGIFTIHCLVLDKNNKPTGLQASYRQVVLPKSDYQTLQKFREYKKNIDKSFNTILPNTALALNAVAINEKTAEKISLNLFLGKSKTNSKNYVLTDLTPGVQHQRTYEGSNIKDLFEEFDSKNTYPDGILAYEIPANTLGYPRIKGKFTTDGASLWEEISSGAGWASLGLAVVGLVASFTPAAPIAPFIFMAAGATGAASGTASIIDKVQKGTLTNETLAFDVIMIASSFLGMAGSLSSIVKASSIIKISATGMRYIILTDFVLNGTATVMITYEGFESIQAIQNDKNLTTAEKIDAIVKILGQLTLTAGLLVLSSKNLKGAELENLQNNKKGNTKKSFNPEQHSEFIDTPENLGKRSPKLISKKTQIPEIKNKYQQPSFDQFVTSVEGGFPSDEIARQAYDLFKNKKWTQLEQLFKDHNLNGNWPPNRGASGTINTTLKKGGIFDRYGGWIEENGSFQDKGTFAGKDGTPYTERALPKGADGKPYNRYEILKDIPGVSEGEIIPWFGEKGGGIQYELPASINDLIKEGYIKPIDKAPKNSNLAGPKSFQKKNLKDNENQEINSVKEEKNIIIINKTLENEIEDIFDIRRKKAIEFYQKYNPDMTERQIKSHISGIDFNKPIEVVKLPEGTELIQYTKVNTEGIVLRGDYYTNNPNHTPSELGVSDKYNVQTPDRVKTSEVKEVTKEVLKLPKDVEGLKSTSAEINDTWSRIDEYGQELPIYTKGGGIQIYIPKSQF